jgi:hypothetical protein
MRLPNFFIVGAPKAGTDELYYHLDQHPQVYMSPLKEPCFFSAETRVENFVEELQPGVRAAAGSLRIYLDEGAKSKRFGGIVTCIRDYQRLFCGARDETAIGEGSVSYLWSPSAAYNIASAIPAARIIIVLMDPVERAFQQYLKSLSDRNVTHSFRVHLEKALRATRDRISIYHPFLAFGDYAEQVRRYKEYFPCEQIHLSFDEDRRQDHEGWFRSILSFLEVDSSFTPCPVETSSAPHFSRLSRFERNVLARTFKPIAAKFIPDSFQVKIKERLRGDVAKPSPCSEDRAILVSYYREDILKLEEMIDRDLSGWLRI